MCKKKFLVTKSCINLWENKKCAIKVSCHQIVYKRNLWEIDKINVQEKVSCH